MNRIYAIAYKGLYLSLLDLKDKIAKEKSRWWFDSFFVLEGHINPSVLKPQFFNFHIYLPFLFHLA
jgi:hypothetical protein